jgi:hypothetical protein
MTVPSKRARAKIVQRGKPLKDKQKVPPVIATPNPSEFDLGSLESRAAARALIEKRRKQEKRIVLIWPGPKPEWFRSDHGKHRWQRGPVEIFCEDDDDYPEGLKLAEFLTAEERS